MPGGALFNPFSSGPFSPSNHSSEVAFFFAGSPGEKAAGAKPIFDLENKRGATLPFSLCWGVLFVVSLPKLLFLFWRRAGKVGSPARFLQSEGSCWESESKAVFLPYRSNIQTRGALLRGALGFFPKSRTPLNVWFGPEL